MLGFLKDTTKNIRVNDLEELIGKAEIIDIRELYEYKTGSLKGTKNIPMGNLISEPEKYLDQNKTYYIMCESGGRSSHTCKVLAKQGFDVINVEGGIISYMGNKRK